MYTFIKRFSTFLLITLTVIIPVCASAQTTHTIDVHTLMQKATVSFSPSTGSFVEGSTFQVPITLDTYGKSVNAVELYVNFDPRRLQIIEPAGQKSIIGLWVEPPVYSNTSGTLKLVGAIPGGVTTKSGIIANITFKALSPGETRLKISTRSQVLANDGVGTPVILSSNDALYAVTFRPPEGPNVFSETHPFPDHWYNNNTPVINWDQEPNVTDYSYVVDSQPFTIPTNTANTVDNRVSPQNIQNGVNYFHIKARKGSVWGGTTHFTLRIDTTPPAEFIPTYEKLTSGSVLVSFFTTDSLSGIDHYEVGVIDMKESSNTTPVFVQTQSPFQLPTKTSGDMRVIVRAIDSAGNVRDEQITVSAPSLFGFVQGNLAILVSLLLFVITIFVSISHYLFVRRISRSIQIATPTPMKKPPQQPVQAPVKLSVLHVQASPQTPQEVAVPDHSQSISS